mmetsp:Transcript_16054/g.26055  ORF Transcript_16054/g.26055 Transcript_16054/m.26055 type:complete len:246 (-) Transcript_16054:82-819(-)
MPSSSTKWSDAFRIAPDPFIPAGRPAIVVNQKQLNSLIVGTRTKPNQISTQFLRIPWLTGFQKQSSTSLKIVTANCGIVVYVGRSSSMRRIQPQRRRRSPRDHIRQNVFRLKDFHHCSFQPLVNCVSDINPLSTEPLPIGFQRRNSIFAAKLRMWQKCMKRHEALSDRFHASWIWDLQIGCRESIMRPAMRSTRRSPRGGQRTGRGSSISSSSAVVGCSSSSCFVRETSQTQQRRQKGTTAATIA